MARELMQRGVAVYSVATNKDKETVWSFETIAELTGGKFFFLGQIKELLDILSATVAIRADKVPSLKVLLKKNQGGMLTAAQRKLLGE